MSAEDAKALLERFNASESPMQALVDHCCEQPDPHAEGQRLLAALPADFDHQVAAAMLRLDAEARDAGVPPQDYARARIKAARK